MLRFWLVPGDLVLSGLRQSAFTELQQNVSLFIWDAASNTKSKRRANRNPKPQVYTEGSTESPVTKTEGKTGPLIHEGEQNQLKE